MKKLNIVTKYHVVSMDFDRYIRLFNEGLSGDQVWQFNEMLRGFLLMPEGVVDAKDVEQSVSSALIIPCRGS
jgi:hypothetical protein